MAGAWGGPRPNSGRKPDPNSARSRRRSQSSANSARETSAPKPPKPKKVPAEPKKDDGMAMALAMQAVAEASKLMGRRKGGQARTIDSKFNPFRPAEHPPEAMPPENLRMPTIAMDSAAGWASGAWAGAILDSVATEGLLFLGYPYLSELAQRPEYRVISETIADDSTRKWIDFEVVGDKDDERRKKENDPAGYDEMMADPDERKKRVASAGKTDRVKKLKDHQEQLEARSRFYDVLRNDGFFGRSHLFMDFGDPDNQNELKTDIGDGRDGRGTSKIKRDSFHKLKVIEPVWTYPMAYNATNPLLDGWYDPQVWYVMGQEVHGSRLLPFIGHPVPDLLKPAYSFGGLSLSQMAKPYVDIWLTTRESVASLIHSFSVMVLMTDMQTILQPGNTAGLLARVAMFNALRDNQGTFVVNKAAEDFKNVSAPISGLDELQAQAQEHMASVTRIPIVKLTGISPKGLNASSEGEIMVYDDTIAAYQNRLVRPGLSRVINFEQISLWGEVDPEITFIFNPLRELTEKERAEKQKQEADRDQVYVDLGAISPAEVRKRIIDDPELPYADLDPDDVPEPPDPMGMGDDPEGGGEGGGGGFNGPVGGERGGASDAVLPFALDALFNESDHPRANNGQFGSGGGGSSSAAPGPSSAEKIANAATMYGSGSKQHKEAIKRFGGAAGGGKSSAGAPLDPRALKRVGKQMGSNPGGVFENAAGEKFYVKQGQTPEHVRNELAAAALYKLAGAPTLNYRAVDGGKHIATEMAKLDKDRAHKLSPEEVAKAREDFITHAWLANWDAVGTGGDNLGTVKGTPTALDLGGALVYRAQGGEKGAAFGPKVGEIETMRSAQTSPDAARVFGGMSDADMRKSAEKVTKIPNAAIAKTISDAGMPESVAKTLIERKADIAKRFSLQAMDEEDAHGHEHAPPGSSTGGQFVSKGGGGGGSSGETDHEKEVAKLAGFMLDPSKTAQPQKVFKSKKEHAAHLLSNPKGVTTQQMLTALGWPSISMPQTAKTLGMKLEKFKVDGVTKYKGTPMTEAELAAAKSEEKAAKTAKAAGAAATAAASPAPPPPEPVKPKADLPKPTDAELAVAKKATSFPTQGYSNPIALKAVQDFNEKYAGKTMTDEAALAQKVADYKQLKETITAANAASQAEQAAAAKKLAEEQAAKVKAAAELQKKKADEAAAALKATQDAAKAKNKEYMKELGISETEASGFDALVTMMGKDSSSKELVAQFKKFEQDAAALGYPISGFQYALIRNYINGGYRKVNPELRSTTWTPQMHVYARLVNNAIDKMPSYTGTVERGTTLDASQLAHYIPGQVVTEHAFTSSGVNFKFDGNVYYTIKANGHRNADFSKGANPSEREVLFKAKTQFLVHKVEKKNGVTHIEMEEVESL